MEQKRYSGNERLFIFGQKYTTETEFDQVVLRSRFGFGSTKHSITMEKVLFFSFLWLPFMGVGQVVDTVGVWREVDSLIQVSRLLTDKSEYEKAFEVNAVVEKLIIKKLGQESIEYGSYCNNQGRIFNVKEDYNKAEFWYLKAISIRRRMLGSESLKLASSLKNLAYLYQDMGDFKKAINSQTEANKIWEKVLGNESPVYATGLNNLANLFLSVGNIDKAKPLYFESMRIREKVLGKDHQDFASSLNNIALLYSISGEIEKVESLLNQALIIYEKTLGKEDPEALNTALNLGDYYCEQGDFEKAEPLLKNSLMAQEKMLGKENKDVAISKASLANLYDEIGEYDKAELLFADAKFIIEKKLGVNHPEYAKTLYNYSLHYLNSGNYPMAELMFKETKSITENTNKNESFYPYSLHGLGVVYLKTGRYKEAESLLLEAINIRKETIGKNHPEYAASLHRLGNLYMEMGMLEKSEKCFLEAKRIREKKLGKKHLFYLGVTKDLASLYELEHKYAESEALLNECFDLLVNRFDNSIAFLSERELNSFFIKFQADMEKPWSYISCRQDNGYEKGALSNLYYNDLLFQKGFMLTAARRLNLLAATTPETVELNNRLKGFRRRLATELSKPIAKQKGVEELEEKSNVTEKELARLISGYAEAIRQVKWQDVKSILKKEEAAIEFIHYDLFTPNPADSTMYAALLLMPGDTAPHFIPLCEERQLEAIIFKPDGSRANYLQNLYAAPRKDKLSSLYELLWAPIEKVLAKKGVKTVYYSPSGLLHRINLSAISKDQSGQTLVNQYQLVPLGSTRELVTKKSSPTLPQSALIYGGIHYEMDSTAIKQSNLVLNAEAQDTTGGLFQYSSRSTERGDSWEPLPSTEKEARLLKAMLKKQGVDATLRLGNSASEESFKQIGKNGPSPNLLHIGTHGFFFPDPKDTTKRRANYGDDAPAFKISEHPLIRSGLLLAGAKYAWENKHPMHGMEDGILTAYEVSQMNLSNTQLVVLSACETGLGDIKGNEGVYGLQRAFRIAGAKNILMSLWKVDDQVTEKLLTEFYTNWLERKLPMRESLEKAQAWLHGQELYRNPYYWAGFVLIGE